MSEASLLLLHAAGTRDKTSKFCAISAVHCTSVADNAHPAQCPFDFQGLLRDAVRKDLGELQVPVASIPHLIRMKHVAGRARDLEDIDKLTQIMAADTGASE